MCINSLKVSNCVQDENHLSNSDRAQVVENQNKVLIIRLAE